MSTEKIIVTIPAGINALSALRIRGQGNEVYWGEQLTCGDLYIVVDYPRENKGVTLDDGNIYTTVRVSFNAVINESEVTIDVLGCKDIKLKLDASQKSGHIYQIIGCGANSEKNAYVKVFIDFPKNKISKEDSEKLIKVMREIYGEPATRIQPEEALHNS
jgi:DnaJ-class molecular chaperone